MLDISQRKRSNPFVFAAVGDWFDSWESDVIKAQAQQVVDVLERLDPQIVLQSGDLMGTGSPVIDHHKTVDKTLGMFKRWLPWKPAEWVNLDTGGLLDTLELRRGYNAKRPTVDPEMGDKQASRSTHLNASRRFFCVIGNHDGVVEGSGIGTAGVSLNPNPDPTSVVPGIVAYYANAPQDPLGPWWNFQYLHEYLGDPASDLPWWITSGVDDPKREVVNFPNPGDTRWSSNLFGGPYWPDPTGFNLHYSLLVAGDLNIFAAFNGASPANIDFFTFGTTTYEGNAWDWWRARYQGGAGGSGSKVTAGIWRVALGHIGSPCTGNKFQLDASDDDSGRSHWNEMKTGYSILDGGLGCHLYIGGHDHSCEIATRAKIGGGDTKDVFLTIGNSGGTDTPSTAPASPDWPATEAYEVAPLDFHTEWRDSMGLTGSQLWSKFALIKVSRLFMDIEIWGVNTNDPTHEGEIVGKYTVVHPAHPAPLTYGYYKGANGNTGHIHINGVEPTDEQRHGVEYDGGRNITMYYGQIALPFIKGQSMTDNYRGITDTVPLTGDETDVVFGYGNQTNGGALSVANAIGFAMSDTNDGKNSPSKVFRSMGCVAQWNPTAALAFSTDGTVSLPGSYGGTSFRMIQAYSGSTVADVAVNEPVLPFRKGFVSVYTEAVSANVYLNDCYLRLTYPDVESGRKAWENVQKEMALDWN